LFYAIESLENVKYFFIQKAVDRALKEYPKPNPQLVIDYLDKKNFSNFVNTEALKYFKKKKSHEK